MSLDCPEPTETRGLPNAWPFWLMAGLRWRRQRPSAIPSHQGVQAVEHRVGTGGVARKLTKRETPRREALLGRVEDTDHNSRPGAGC